MKHPTKPARHKSFMEAMGRGKSAKTCKKMDFYHEGHYKNMIDRGNKRNDAEHIIQKIWFHSVVEPLIKIGEQRQIKIYTKPNVNAK